MSELPEFVCPVCGGRASFVYRQSLGRLECIVTLECRANSCEVTKFKVWMREDEFLAAPKEGALCA